MQPAQILASEFLSSLLHDQAGAIRTLNDLAGPNGLFLVFHRSADW
jgi:hypothetical protein